MTIWHLVVLCCVLSAAFAQMALKKAATIKYPSRIREYLNVWVIGGYAVMALVLVVDVFCLSKGVQVKEVSTIESSSYLFVSLLGWLFFKESITWRKAGAIALILAGVIVFFS